jgi:plastocyanin
MPQSISNGPRGNRHWYIIALVSVVIVLVSVYGLKSNRVEAPDETIPSAIDTTTGTTSSKSPMVPAVTTKPKTSVSGSSAVPTSRAPLPTASPSKGIVTVIYAVDGFKPALLEIPRGQSVRFINRSGTSMRLVANTDGGQRPYPGFDQSKTVGPGGVYDFSFTLTGSWGYRNQYDGVHIATVIVK